MARQVKNIAYPILIFESPINSMKRIIAFASLLLLFTYGTSLANSDYSELNDSFTKFFASLDVIVKELPSVNSAAGTVKIIDSWSLANESLCTAGEQFVAKHPEIYSQPQPPPEFIETFGRLKRLKTDYAAIPEGVGKLGNQFSVDPEVQNAMKRFKKSLDRLSGIGRPPQK
jgi:hypothetical protein